LQSRNSRARENPINWIILFASDRDRPYGFATGGGSF
jgi:hypothetical protein